MYLSALSYFLCTAVKCRHGLVLCMCMDTDENPFVLTVLFMSQCSGLVSWACWASPPTLVKRASPSAQYVCEWLDRLNAKLAAWLAELVSNRNRISLKDLCTVGIETPPVKMCQSFAFLWRFRTGSAVVALNTVLLSDPCALNHEVLYLILYLVSLHRSTGWGVFTQSRYWFGFLSQGFFPEVAWR